MKKFLFLAVLAVSFVLLGTMAFAQETVLLEKRLKIEGYAEYINFTGGEIDGDAWGGGVLARYLFLDWLAAQTNITFYNEDYEKHLGGDLKFTNWRLSLLLHTYVPDLSEQLYAYAGGGIGVQFNDDVKTVDVDNAFTGHVLGGIGYDITDLIHVGGEIGYQFGKADLKHHTKGSARVDAFFVRLGAGIRF